MTALRKPDDARAMFKVKAMDDGELNQLQNSAKRVMQYADWNPNEICMEVRCKTVVEMIERIWKLEHEADDLRAAYRDARDELKQGPPSEWMGG